MCGCPSRFAVTWAICKRTTDTTAPAERHDSTFGVSAAFRGGELDSFSMSFIHVGRLTH